MKCWKVVAWGWLEKGYFDGLKYITLDFSTKTEMGNLGWVKNLKMSAEIHRFLIGVDMARRHGMEIGGEKRIRRCIGLREFTIRGVEVDEDTREGLRFWFGENVSFVEGMRPLRGVRKRQIPSITCKMERL